MSAIDFHRSPGAAGMSLWLRQLSAIVRVEVNKTLFSRRAITVYGLTLIPIIFSTVMAFVKDDWGEPLTHNIEQARRVYAYIYSGFILGAVIFLGSAVIFTALFRGEMLDCSMHYYLLAPVRREVLATGKYLAGLISAFGLFGITTILCYLLLYVPYGVAQLIADLVDGVAALQLLNYVGVTFLGCMGYGAVFMTTGLLFRNPLLPVAVLAGWEVIHFVLPPALKVFSVIYYLKGLLPIPLDDGPLAILVAPPPEWVSILGIMGLSAGALAATIFFLKRLEIRYTED